MALPALRQGVLPVERKRMLEMRRRPAILVVAATTLQWIEILLHLLVKRSLGLLVVRPMARNAIVASELHVRDFEILGAFAAQLPREAGEAKQETKEKSFHGILSS